jgi:hypothetical protein
MAVVYGYHRTQFLGDRESHQEMRDRQQLLRLLGQPLSRLVGTTIGTVTVPARTSDPVLVVTRLALIEDASQLSGAAAGDQVEHLAVSEQNPLAELGIVSRNVLPQRVSNGGHRLAEVRRYLFR